jgi:outer membrane protein assembly factor BamB
MLGGALRADEGAKPARGRLACVRVERAGRKWSRDLAGRIVSVRPCADRVYVRVLSGSLFVLARDDGRIERVFSSGGILPNVAVIPRPGGIVALAEESELTCLDLAQDDPSRRELWHRKIRLRDLVPPAWSCGVLAGQHFVLGRTDGLVCALDPDSGATKWELATASCVRRLVACADGSRVFALEYDGRLLAIANGSELWRTDVDQGRESHAQPAIGCFEEGVWCTSPATRSALCISADDGTVLARVRVDQGERTAILGASILVSGADGVRLLRIAERR